MEDLTIDLNAHDELEDSPPRRMDAGALDEGEEPPRKVKKTRNRQQLSCVACHVRKQACDKQSNSPPSTTQDVNSLSQRVVALEAALRATLSGASKDAVLGGLAAGGQSVETEDIETAAVALGQLAKAQGSEGGQWHGPSSLASFLSSTFEPGSSAPHSKNLYLFGPSYASIMAAFPPEPICDLLFDVFFSPASMNFKFSVTRKDVAKRMFGLLLEYLRAVQVSPDISLPLPTSIGFVSLASIILASALQFLPEVSAPVVKQYYPDYHQLEANLVAQAKAALDKSEENESADVYRIEAILLQGLYFKNSGRPLTNYNLFAVAVRTAQSLGMHRNADFGLSPYDTEIRRRREFLFLVRALSLSYMLYSYDRGASLALGRPYLIMDIHQDQKLPANIDLNLIDPETRDPIPDLPLDVPTPYTYQILEIGLSKITAKMADRCFSCLPHTHKDVLECDAELAAFEESWPKSFKSPSFELIQKHPFLPHHKQMMNLHVSWMRSLLHRPYLLLPLDKTKPDRYLRSRATAIEMAQKIISLQRDAQVPLTVAQKKFFFLAFQCFDPACSLAMAILQDPTNVAQAEALDAWILESRLLLTRMGSDNTVAIEGIKCIDALRRKVAEVVPAGTRLGPLASVEPGPVPIPYMGLSASIGTSGNSPSGSSLATSPYSSPENFSSDGSLPPSTSEAMDPMFFADGSGDEWLSANVPVQSWPLPLHSLETLNGGAGWNGLLREYGIMGVDGAF
ncbi:hypothetical protein MNV49_002293 [Pseudohyphozyma bogoriensis]|nr:hypothetical protein MNV49_002293 [Pseudohyphozyma bogoriensis]